MELGLIPLGTLPTLQLRVNDKVYVYNHRTPTPEEVACVVSRLPPESAFVVQLLAATGARIGELLSLRRDRIDVKKGVVRLNGKTGPRDFPLTDGLIKLLGDRIDHSDKPLIQHGRRGHEAAAFVSTSRSRADRPTSRRSPHTVSAAWPWTVWPARVWSPPSRRASPATAPT
jgi:integrase